MIEYIKNLLPRLVIYSETLNKTELFVEQPWVFIDENNQKHTYIFERSGTLIMSVNGVGLEGTWRFINANNSIWIDRVTDKLLLNQGFISEGVMLLKRDGVIDPFMLINSRLIPDLDVKTYLDGIISSKELKEPTASKKNSNVIELEDKNVIETSDAFTLNNLENNIGLKVLKSDFPVLSGEYKVEGLFKTNIESMLISSHELFLIIENNEIINAHFIVKYKIRKNNHIIKQKSLYLSNGDMCLAVKGVRLNGMYYIKGYTSDFALLKKGIIVQASIPSFILIIVLPIIILIISLIAIMNLFFSK